LSHRSVLLWLFWRWGSLQLNLPGLALNQDPSNLSRPIIPRLQVWVTSAQCMRLL
jgi:hypothetical protein